MIPIIVKDMPASKGGVEFPLRLDCGAILDAGGNIILADRNWGRLAEHNGSYMAERISLAFGEWVVKTLNKEASRWE